MKLLLYSLCDVSTKPSKSDRKGNDEALIKRRNALALHSVEIFSFNHDASSSCFNIFMALLFACLVGEKLPGPVRASDIEG